MPAHDADFDAPDLAARIEEMAQDALDRLPFGVILLDRDGTVQFYSETERRESGFGRSPIGQNFFAVSRCAGMDEFKGRIMRAHEAGAIDLEFGWLGDYGDANRELRIRVQSSRRGGFWLFIQRDH